MQINGATLTVIRERSGLTQSDLSRMTGVSQGRISELESGDLTVRPATAMAISKALAIPVVALIAAAS